MRNEKQEEAIKARNAEIAKAMLGSRITKVKFDNNDDWTGFHSCEITLESGVSVEFVQTWGDHGEGCGIEIIVSGKPEDEEGLVFTWS